MELASRIRWILILIIGIVFLFFIGWGLFSIANNVFRGDSSDNGVVEPKYNVTSAATARFTNDGPIVGTEQHRSYTIDVSENVVTMKVYSNYGQTVIAERSYRNTSEAFDTFMAALDNLDVTSRLRGTDNNDDNNDAGVCPLGQRFILELDNDLRRWSTTCSDREGTAGFDMNDVLILFERQVPDYQDLIRGTRL